MDSQETRRGFLSVGVAAISGVIGAMMAVFSVPYIFAPLLGGRKASREDADFQDLGPVEELQIGAWQLIPLTLAAQDGWQERRVRHAVWVRCGGRGENQITVLSSICPHLGCLVNWQSDQGQFVCPCHGGTFHSSGQCVAGPPPRSMDRLEHKVRDGRLLVRWLDFKSGAAESLPLGT